MNNVQEGKWTDPNSNVHSIKINESGAEGRLIKIKKSLLKYGIIFTHVHKALLSTMADRFTLKRINVYT